MRPKPASPDCSGGTGRRGVQTTRSCRVCDVGDLPASLRPRLRPRRRNQARKGVAGTRRRGFRRRPGLEPHLRGHVYRRSVAAGTRLPLLGRVAELRPLTSTPKGPSPSRRIRTSWGGSGGSRIGDAPDADAVAAVLARASGLRNLEWLGFGAVGAAGVAASGRLPHLTRLGTCYCTSARPGTTGRRRSPPRTTLRPWSSPPRLRRGRRPGGRRPRDPRDCFPSASCTSAAAPIGDAAAGGHRSLGRLPACMTELHLWGSGITDAGARAVPAVRRAARAAGPQPPARVPSRCAASKSCRPGSARGSSSDKAGAPLSRGKLPLPEDTGRNIDDRGRSGGRVQNRGDHHFRLWREVSRRRGRPSAPGCCDWSRVLTAALPAAALGQGACTAGGWAGGSGRARCC